MMQNSSKIRHWEIDFLKGMAIIGVVLYHFIFDLIFFGHYKIDDQTLFCWILARSSAFLFIFLSGVSLVISFERSKKQNKKIFFYKIFFRSSYLLFFGLIITFITYFVFPQAPIIFGILHFLAFASLVGFFFINQSYFAFLSSIFILLISQFINNIDVNSYSLLWLGFVPKYFESVDYFPFIPWFAFYLLGIIFGNKFYKDGKRNFNLKNCKNKIVQFLCLCGRHTLLIYLIHQPILFIFFFDFKTLVLNLR